MRAWLTAAISGVALLGCGDQGGIALSPPQALAGLDGVEVTAEVEVFGGRDRKDPEGDAHPMQKKGDRFQAEIDLDPGTYFFWIRFKADDGAGAVRIADYRDLKHTVESRAAAPLDLGKTPLYIEFDEDDDGIPNLYEIKYAFDLRGADGDPSADLAGARPAITRTSVTMWLGAPRNEGAIVETPEQQLPVAPFAMDRYEVSNRRYRVCVASGACAPPLGQELTAYLDASEVLDQPAAGVTQGDAIAFCEQIAGGRLPYEHEWEYAARRTRDQLYPWSDNALLETVRDRGRCDFVNARYYQGDVAKPCEPDVNNAPTLFAVDAYGDQGPLEATGCVADADGGQHAGPCQLAGNVWEWTQSQFVRYDGSAWPWESPGDQEELWVIRGGSADSLDYSLRSTFRVGVDSKLADSPSLAPFVGFRCVYDLD